MVILTVVTVAVDQLLLKLESNIRLYWAQAVFAPIS